MTLGDLRTWMASEDSKRFSDNQVLCIYQRWSGDEPSCISIYNGVE